MEVLPSTHFRRKYGLVFSRDTEPGISRRRAGSGFAYRRNDGRAVRGAEELARIRALAIPPAYVEVWICRRANGHLQATGLDARGRKQYRYHPQWRQARDAEKYDGLMDVASRLPAIRRRAARDVGDAPDGRSRLVATVVRLMDTTCGRVGNDEYMRENGSFGLTTLRTRHARLDGDRLTLSFPGKSGVAQQAELRDARVAAVVRECLARGAGPLFRHRGDDGVLRGISSTDVNDYLARLSQGQVTAKDFRTWHASVMALAIVHRAIERGDERFTLKAMLAGVAGKLGNTPAVCRKSYVHPEVIALAMLASRGTEQARRVLRQLAGGAAVPVPAGLRRDEARLVDFLQRIRRFRGKTWAFC